MSVIGSEILVIPTVQSFVVSYVDCTDYEAKTSSWFALVKGKGKKTTQTLKQLCNVLFVYSIVNQRYTNAVDFQNIS